MKRKGKLKLKFNKEMLMKSVGTAAVKIAENIIIEKGLKITDKKYKAVVKILVGVGVGAFVGNNKYISNEYLMLDGILSGIKLLMDNFAATKEFSKYIENDSEIEYIESDEARELLLNADETLLNEDEFFENDDNELLNGETVEIPY